MNIEKRITKITLEENEKNIFKEAEKIFFNIASEMRDDVVVCYNG